jgi:hypothetical protein
MNRVGGREIRTGIPAKSPLYARIATDKLCQRQVQTQDSSYRSRVRPLKWPRGPYE